MNIKKIEPASLLRLFLGLVFLSAGLFRIFNWQKGIIEFSELHLPFAAYLLFFTVCLEIIGGLMLIFNIKTKEALLVFVVFIILALLQALIFSFGQIQNTAAELFFFKANSVDLFLHFTYLIILFCLFSLQKREK